MNMRTLAVLAGAGLMLGTGLAEAQRGQPDRQPVRSLEITVEDLGSGAMLPTLRRGDTVVIQPGQQIRLRMTGIVGPNSPVRYPATRFTPNQSRTVRIDRVNPEVGSIILTGQQPNTGPGALVIEYQVTDPMPIGDDRERTGRVYVRVESGQPEPLPEPVPPPNRPGRPPGGDQGVTLFSDEYYRGRSQTFYADDPDFRDNPIQNDSVSSVRVDPGCRAILFADTSYRGRSSDFDRDTPNMQGTSVGNDSASSLRVECDRSGSRGITVFADANFRGSSDTLGEGDYPSLDQSIGNDRISSIRVDRGCRAVLFEDGRFRGRSWTIDRDVSRLDGTPVGNDSISSIQVYCGR